MKPIAAFLGWTVLLVVEYYTATVSSVPTSGLHKFRNGLNVMAGSQTRDKIDAIERRLIKSPNIFEKPEKKSQLQKKTSVSVNGHLLPIAGISSTDKTVHVTVQNAAGQSTQPVQQTQLNGQAPMQAVVQEVVPGTSNTVLSPSPQGPVGMAPPIIPGQGVPNSELNPGGAVGMAPPRAPAQLLSNSQPNSVGQVPLGMAPPRSPAQLLSNSQPNSVGQVPLGMAPPRSPAQLLSNPLPNSVDQVPLGMAPPLSSAQLLSNSQPNSVEQVPLGMAPPSPPGVGSQGLQVVTQPQLPAQGLPNTFPNSLQSQGTPQTVAQGACNPVADSLLPGNKKAVHLGTNSEGQLTYKPIAC